MMTSLSSSRINPTIQSPPLQSSKAHPLFLLLRPLPQATVAAIPRTRSAIILHALRCLISTGILATSPSGAVEFNQYIDALSALEEQLPDPWRDFEIANADPSVKIETIGGKLWLSHIDISRIQLVTEEWFRLPHDPKTGNISPVISTSLVKVPQGSVSAIPSSPTKDSATSEKSPGSPSDNPLTLASALIVQALTDESGVPLNIPAATVTVPSECPTSAQGKETPVTFGSSSSPATTRAAASVPAVDEGQFPIASECTGGESPISLVVFPPLPPSDTAPPPVPKQSPQLAPKQASRAKNKGSRLSAIPSSTSTRCLSFPS